MTRFRQAGHRQGFALLEVLIALTLVALALLFVLQLLLFDVRAQSRLAAQQEVLEILEGMVESVRVGSMLATTTTFEHAELMLLLDRPTRPLTVEMTVLPHPTVPDLFELRLVAHYQAGREPQRRELETRLWRPF